MIRLRWTEGHKPQYQTLASAGADLCARESITIPAKGRSLIPTGVWIDKVDATAFAPYLPELQIRARSGLAFRHGIMLTNGVGTVDIDYPEEICVLLYNSGDENFTVEVGDRIAQLVCGLTYQISGHVVSCERQGGFGSTSANSK